MRQLLFYDAPLRKHTTIKIAQYRQCLEREEMKAGKEDFCDGLLWLWKTVEEFNHWEGTERMHL